jgi:hypothetical protein
MIQIAYNGNGFQELIYGAEGISNNTSNKNLGVPGDPGILVGQANGIGLHLGLTCSSFPDIKNLRCHYYPPLGKLTLPLRIPLETTWSEASKIEADKEMKWACLLNNEG